jgi:hypothetical protein
MGLIESNLWGSRESGIESYEIEEALHPKHHRKCEMHAADDEIQIDEGQGQPQARQGVQQGARSVPISRILKGRWTHITGAAGS